MEEEGLGEERGEAECSSDSIIYHFLTKYSMHLRKRLIWASPSVAKGINPCWVWHKLLNPSNMIHTLNWSPRWAAGTGCKGKCSPSSDNLPWKIYDFPLKLANLWMCRDACGIGKQSIPSSVISQLQAGNPHLHVPRKLALDDHSVGKSKQKWASKFQETQTWSSMRSLAKKPTICEAVKACICVNPGFPHFFWCCMTFALPASTDWVNKFGSTVHGKD